MRAQAVRVRLLAQLDGWVHTSRRFASRSSYYTSCRATTVSYSQWVGLGSLSARNKCYPTEQKGKEGAMPDLVREWDYKGATSSTVERMDRESADLPTRNVSVEILQYTVSVQAGLEYWTIATLSHCVCASEMAWLVCYFLPFYNQVNLRECKGVIRREWVRESCNDWLIVMSGRHEVIRAQWLQK